ncbi:MAG: MFS transporter [Gammaproteobacteria bacterium]|jgi:MFS family permease
MPKRALDPDVQSQTWLIATIAFLGGLGGGVVFPILPLVGIDLGISGFMVGLILSANRITRLGFNPVTGSLLDRFGARWPVAVGLVIEALGTFAFSIALTAQTPAAWFLAGRVVWGVGSSLLMVGVLAAVMAIAPLEKRGGMVARVRTAISLGLPAGLVIGGVIADRASANTAFIVAGVLSVVGAVVAVFALPKEAHPPKSADDAPAGSTDREGWRKLLRMPVLHMVWSTNGLLFFAMSGVLLSTVAVVAKQRSLFVFSLGAQGSAGLLMAVMMMARAGAALAAGRHLDRVSSRTSLLLPSMLMLAVGFGALGYAGHTVTAMGALVLVGAGSGGLTIPLLTVLGDVSPREFHGRALSVYQWSSDFGGAVGPAAGLELGHAFGYELTYLVVGLTMLAMVLPLRVLIARRR